MKECEFFPYSKEYYNIFKEASELDVMEQCLESNLFVIENPELIQESVSVLTEGYLFESDGEIKIEVMEEKIQEKLKNLGNKIASSVDKIIKMVIAAFKKCMEIIGKFKDRAKEIYDYLQINKLTKQQQEDIDKLVGDATANWEQKYDIAIHENQAAKIPRGMMLVTGPRSTYKKVAAALGGTSIRINLKAEWSKKALSDTQLVKFLKDYNKGRLNSASSIASAQSGNARSGLVLGSDLTERLKELGLNDKAKETEIAGAENVEKEKGNTAKAEALKALNEAISPSIRIINAVIAYRQLIVKNLSFIIGSDTNVKPTKKAAEAPKEEKKEDKK
jgi:hypothetical protein